MGIFDPIISIFGYFLSLFIDFLTSRIYQSKIIFNTCWEDVRCDQEAMKIGPKDTVLIISSAGENAINHALNGAKKVICIDRNPCQNALVELKIAAIKELDYDTFWKIFGEGVLPNFTKECYPRLRKHLSPSAAEFWDGHSHYFDGGWFRKSFYFRGMAGALGWLIYIYLKAVPGLHKGIMTLIEMNDSDKRKEFYFNNVERTLWNPIARKLLENSATLTGIGVPVAQQELLSKEMNIGMFLKRAIEIMLTELPLKENFYYRIYIEGRYQKDACPDYLIEENFNKLKDGLIDRIEIHTTTITEYLKSYEKKDITKFILLDHMDWMQAHPDMLSEEWQEIIDHASPDAQMIWRSAAKKTTFVDETKVEFKGKETTVGDILEYDIELADKLHAIDRVQTYTSFWIASFKDKDVSV